MTVFADNSVRKTIAYDAVPGCQIVLSWHAVTDVGTKRETNEDSLVAKAAVFAVADGMGGHAAGDLASDAVAVRINEFHDSKSINRDGLNTALMRAVADIDQLAEAEGAGAGTTVTGLMFSSDKTLGPSWDVFNIGDSRVYQFFEGMLTQVTVDHSIVQHLIDTGAITADEAETHPHANVITRAVGYNEDPVPDYVSLAIVPGQRLLVCSDGLTKELTDAGIRHFLEVAGSAEEAANELLTQALNNSGRDNITVIVIDVHEIIFAEVDAEVLPGEAGTEMLPGEAGAEVQPGEAGETA